MRNRADQSRSPTRMGQHEAEARLSAWTQLKKTMFGCWKDNDTSEHSELPMSRVTSIRAASPHPTRPSEHEVSERLRLPDLGRSFAGHQPACGHNRTKAVSHPAPPVTGSRTARIVPKEDEEEEGAGPQLAAKTTSDGASSTAKQWRRLQVEQREEQDRYQAQLIKLREAQRILTSGMDSYHGDDEMNRDGANQGKEPALSREQRTSSTAGSNISQRDQQRFDDMRGHVEVSTPTPPPRIVPNLLAGSDLTSLPLMRRRLEAQRQATAVTDQDELLSRGEKGNSREPTEVVSRRLPTPQAYPRPMYDPASSSQIQSSPVSMQEQIRKLT